MRRFIVALTALLCMAAPAVGYADGFDPLSGACSAGGDASQSSGCQVTSGDPIGGQTGALRKVANIISIIAGIAAVIVIIVAGLQYVTSGGDSQKVAGARNMIIGALIGLAIIALAQSIIIFVLKKT